MSSRRQLEALLAERGLGRTLTAFRHEWQTAAGGELEQLFSAGALPGAITELVARSEGAFRRVATGGLTTAAFRLCTLALRDGTRSVAWLDPAGALDAASAARAGIALERLLWVASPASSQPRRPDAVVGRAGETTSSVRRTPSAQRQPHYRRTNARWTQARACVLFLQSAQMLVQAGGFSLVLLDFSDFGDEELAVIPRSAWFRLLRAVEWARNTAVLVLSPVPLTNTCGALVIELRCERTAWDAALAMPRRLRDLCPLLGGATFSARVLQSRRWAKSGPRDQGATELEASL